MSLRDRSCVGEDEVGSKRILTVDYSIKPALVGLDIESHPNRSDVVEIDPSKLTSIQVTCNGETGHECLRHLKASGKPLLDHRVQEELYKQRNQNFIPEDWKEKNRIYFFGTIFRDTAGDLLAPHLYYQRASGWRWLFDWLDDRLDGLVFAASLLPPVST
jgi:hypothetical protein